MAAYKRGLPENLTGKPEKVGPVPELGLLAWQRPEASSKSGNGVAQEEQSDGDGVAVAKPKPQPYSETVDRTQEACSGKEAKGCDWTVHDLSGRMVQNPREGLQEAGIPLPMATTRSEGKWRQSHKVLGLMYVNFWPSDYLKIQLLLAIQGGPKRMHRLGDTTYAPATIAPALIPLRRQS